MAFEPFGYRFEVRSQMPVADAKAALRAQKKRWFDGKNGPRGWIVGPVVCLWLSPLDRRGPMLIGSTSQDGFGSRIRGRAGSDLNGMAYLALMTAIVLFAAVQMMRQGDPGIKRLALYFGPLFVGGVALIAWWSHKDRHDADPLVRFVRRTLGEDGERRSRGQRARDASIPTRLLVGGSLVSTAPTNAEIETAVEEAQYDVDRFVILTRDEQHYMQAALRNGGLILEKREGSAAEHFAARRETGAASRTWGAGL